ncbi:hypothetical protein F4780DRAFT_502713 [Xylariomycetidae sp. FL0641]|nr:hypothetical protein F4780DRAFT_502713 [Xylariomycetidae sp. FL0641]
MPLHASLSMWMGVVFRTHLCMHWQAFCKCTVCLSGTVHVATKSVAGLGKRRRVCIDVGFGIWHLASLGLVGRSINQLLRTYARLVKASDNGEKLSSDWTPGSRRDRHAGTVILGTSSLL